MTTDLEKALEYLEDLLLVADGDEEETTEIRRLEVLLNKLRILEDLDVTILDRVIEFQKNEARTARIFETVGDGPKTTLDLLQKLRNMCGG